ncbi:MAG: hypothetical protein LBG15_12835 [Dysgonamonadaceae bacterium]|jgi:hypothetical protein|nr:hypothetical protein [Dysgonamonadaceae bacterium]
MKTKVLLSGIMLFAAIAFSTCDKSYVQQDDGSSIDNIVYQTVFEDLPVGCDSVQMISPQNSIFKSITHPDGELSASLFYYSEGKIVAVLSNGRVATAQIFKNNKPASEELTVEEIVSETNLRSSFIDSYVFSTSGKVIFTMTKNSDGTWGTNTYLRSYIGCVDEVSEQMCNGSLGSTARILCKLCSPCAVAAAAVVCLF